MHLRPLLLTAATTLAMAHVVGVLFAHPLFRPAELVAALCLLAYAIRYDLLAHRHPAWPGAGEPAGEGGQPTVAGQSGKGGKAGAAGPGGAGTAAGGGPAGRDRVAGWGPTAAAAVLVAGAAMTLPPEPGGGGGLQILSPEEYSVLASRVRLTSLVPVVVALLVVLVLLAAQRGPAVGARIAAARRKPGRAILGTGIAAAVLIVGYLVLRAAVIEFGAPRQSISSFAWSPTVWGLPAAVITLLPLLLALTALALAVVTARRGRRRAASGAVLLAVVGLIWLDSGIGAVPLPYAVDFNLDPYGSGWFTSTAASPQPIQAVTAALRLAAGILVVTGLTRPPPASP